MSGEKLLKTREALTEVVARLRREGKRTACRRIAERRAGLGTTP